MKVHVETPQNIIEKTADSRGRVVLGSEFAGDTVQVAVLEVVSDDK